MTETLKVVTKQTTTPILSEEKYRVVAPEAMHETFMSDSEEEGGISRSHLILNHQTRSSFTSLIFFTKIRLCRLLEVKY